MFKWAHNPPTGSSINSASLLYVIPHISSLISSVLLWYNAPTKEIKSLQGQIHCRKSVIYCIFNCAVNRAQYSARKREHYELSQSLYKLWPNTLWWLSLWWPTYSKPFRTQSGNAANFLSKLSAARTSRPLSMNRGVDRGDCASRTTDSLVPYYVCVYRRRCFTLHALRAALQQIWNAVEQRAIAQRKY